MVTGDQMKLHLLVGKREVFLLMSETMFALDQRLFSHEQNHADS